MEPAFLQAIGFFTNNNMVFWIVYDRQAKAVVTDDSAARLILGFKRG